MAGLRFIRFAVFKTGRSQSKGLFQRQKNTTGRQLARISAIRYRETIWSELYPGSQHTINCLQPSILAAENALDLSPKQRKRTVIRTDGGAGSDEHIRWLLARNYHVMMKGVSNRRAKALAKQVRRWDPYEDYWLGEVDPLVDYGRPVRVFVKRRKKKDVFHHSYYVSSLSLPCKSHFMALYNQRGGAEVEQFRSDKNGLHLEVRRKHNFYAQKGFILLNDLAHNLLADFYHRALLGSRFETYGVKRIVRDLLRTPGNLVFEQGNLVRIELLSKKQFSKDLAICLERYCSG